MLGNNPKLVYNIVSEVGYALAVDEWDPTGQLVLADVNSASNLQLWTVSYWWGPEDLQRTFMTIVNVYSGLAASPLRRGDSSPVGQISLEGGPPDALTWVFHRTKIGRVVGAITAGYETNCYPDGNHWCQVMNAEGDNYHPGVKIITYHLDNSYPKNSLWEFRPGLL